MMVCGLPQILDPVLPLPLLPSAKLLVHQKRDLDRFCRIRVERDKKSSDGEGSHDDEQQGEDRLVIREKDREDYREGCNKKVGTQTVDSIDALRILGQGGLVAKVLAVSG
jgi:hypothetical protein